MGRPDAGRVRPGQQHAGVEWHQLRHRRPAPTVAGIQRQVQEVTAYNNDTVSHTLFLREHDGANTRVILEATLAPGASFRYPQSSVPTGGTVTNIATTFGITGGPITNSGTISSTGQAINTQSAGYTAANSDIGKVINMTSSSAATLTLNPAVLTADWWCYVNCALSGSSAAAKVLTYTPSSGTFDGAAAGYDYPGAQRIIQFDGTNFNSILLRGGFLEFQNSDSPFTAQLPTGVNMHKFMCLGAGGAGASGRRGAQAAHGAVVAEAAVVVSNSSMRQPPMCRRRLCSQFLRGPPGAWLLRPTAPTGILEAPLRARRSSRRGPSVCSKAGPADPALAAWLRPRRAAAPAAAMLREPLAEHRARKGARRASTSLSLTRTYRVARSAAQTE